MRLFQILIVLAAMLDVSMVLASSTSPLATGSPTQTIGFSAENILDTGLAR